MKKYIIIAIILVVIFIIGFESPNSKNLKGKYNIEISFKDYGKVSLTLDADNSPITVTNFINLVNDKFYDGLTIHRVVEDFMIQGGDPLGDGTGGSKEKIKGEFSENGVKNNLSHKRGVISMARSNDYNSASSQFFIMQKDNTNLDGLYASFGEVTDGIEIIDKIVEDKAKLGDDNGMLKTSDQVEIEYIKVVK